MESKPASSISLWPLIQFLPSASCFELLLWFPLVIDYNLETSERFLLQLIFLSVFIRVTEANQDSNSFESFCKAIYKFLFFFSGSRTKRVFLFRVRLLFSP